MPGLPGLKKRREARRLTQEALAEKVGVSAQSIYLYESGRAYPSVPVLMALAEHLKCSTTVLLNAPAEAAS